MMMSLSLNHESQDVSVSPKSAQLSFPYARVRFR
jgi:hypothetical protein